MFYCTTIDLKQTHECDSLTAKSDKFLIFDCSQESIRPIKVSPKEALVHMHEIKRNSDYEFI